MKGPDTRAAFAPRQVASRDRWLAVLKHLLQGSSSGRQLGGILVRSQMRGNSHPHTRAHARACLHCHCHTRSWAGCLTVSAAAALALREARAWRPDGAQAAEIARAALQQPLLRQPNRAASWRAHTHMHARAHAQPACASHCDDTRSSGVQRGSSVVAA